MSAAPFISHHLFVAAAVPTRQVPRDEFEQQSSRGRLEADAESESMFSPESIELWTTTQAAQVLAQGGDRI
jgi:hypothetical protein